MIEVIDGAGAEAQAGGAAAGGAAADAAQAGDGGSAGSASGADIVVPSEAERTPSSGRVVSGNPSDEELAAIVAVLRGILDSGSTADRPRDLMRPASRWERSQRMLRGGAGDPFRTDFGRL
ncbi:hypothetical protein USB125703_01025 [Pseudoclavibacter triregionum]|nr:hypothetical protein USB125703_01025 [Pseudoclavibacter triregionum]